jgi:triacylglycerol lipase
VTRAAAVVAAAVLLLVVPGGPARSTSEPAVSVDRGAVLHALHCPSSFAHASPPVLLVHGTGSTAAESWDHDFAKTLPAQGYDVCTIDLPARSLDDIQVASEYVVVAVEEMSARTGRRVDVVGHSQGGLEPRWALRWFPSIRGLVDDYIAMSAPQHGSQDAAGACAAGSCAPAVWQQVPGSAFLKALNSGDETPGDVSYTSIYSLTDEVVPELPGRPVNHVGMLTHAVAHALVLDALGHAGPADPSRVAASACLVPLAPGIDAADFAYVQVIGLGTAGVSTLVTGPKTAAEPPLAPYVAGEQAATAPPAQAAPASAASAPPGSSPSVRGSSLAATGASPSTVLALAALAAALAGGALSRRLSALSG